ncbi:hypothetical protein OsJ_15626 [Oryza sativa Japonica Group]|uniref:Uncharacterized protein n=1 Tax=Oryza sativa subsp. japonica TaxID=39947 RepID=A3AW01_ORYSJ|nr:hypothetical protein OsJ_15626 [Oryza sativa Japonica Group]
MDSYEKEKKKKKQILTKNMEVKKIKSTTNNLPGADRTKSQVTGNTTEELRRKKTVEGTISAVESTKDIKLDTKKKEPLQMKISHENFNFLQLQVMKKYKMKKEEAKNQIRAILWQNILKKPKVRPLKLFQDLITSRILEKGKKSATIGSEIGKNKAQILYDQYTFLNENERLVKGGQMSYTNLMQHIILSPRVSLQANEVSEVYNLGIFKK